MENSLNNTSIYLGITSGGRTVNERPLEYLINTGADIDIASAYGTELVNSKISIGRPSIYSFTPNQTKRYNLSGFLKRFEHKILKNNYYKIIVKGKLPFQQDLLHSRYISENVLTKKILNVDSLDVDEQVLKSDFLLLRKEIINGVITSKTLDILPKVCSSQEISEIYNLEVVAAIFYEDDNICQTFDDYLEESMKDRGDNFFDLNFNVNKDTRTQKSFIIELEEFINPILKERQRLKKLSDPISQAKSNALKLIINTLWGIITSVYFSLNNVITSEIVTNNTRHNVWLTSKALNTHLSITDGGMYNLTRVSFLKPHKYKPCLNDLSSYYKYKNHQIIIHLY